ncbi:MAG: peroxiredoxin [Sumerlaeia bacterium]
MSRLFAALICLGLGWGVAVLTGCASGDRQNAGQVPESTDTLPIGAEAPKFRLFDSAGNGVALEDFAGRPVVLVFYPGNDTPTCTRQLCELRDDWGAFEKEDVAVLAINPADGASHARFKAEYDLPFPLLVDPGGEVAKAYMSQGVFGINRRTVYAVGPDGRIVFAERGRPTPARILQAIASEPASAGAAGAG